MDTPGVTAGIVIILLVIAGGCSALSPTPKSTARPGSSGENAMIETPTLPDQYTARDLQADSPNPAHPGIVVTRGERPVLRSGAQTEINGTGLTGLGTSNETNAQIVTYLTNEQNYTNQTVLNAETQFWNAVAYYVLKKMDSTNTTTISYTQARVNPSHAGAYSVNQTSDLWNATVTDWTYITDPPGGDSPFGDHFNAASESITNGLQGDCDDFAILMATTNIVLGGNSRVIYAANPTASEAHMYAEAQYDNTSFVPIIQARYNLSNTTTVYYHPGNWLNLDWFNYPAAASHPGGNFYPDGGKIWVIYQHGNWEKLRQNGTTWDVILQGNA
jgi:hypothetical protein